MSSRCLWWSLFALLAGPSLRADTPSATALPAGVAALMSQSATEIGRVADERHVVFERDALASNAVMALARALDPFAAILTPEQVARHEDALRGVYYDVGLKFKIKAGRPSVMETSKGATAETAGVKTGDVVDAVGETTTEGLTLDALAQLLRGGKDQSVTLRVRGEGGTNEARTVTLARSAVQAQITGSIEEWPQQIGYLKINGLYAAAGAQITTQLVGWAASNYSGIILDLRGANGLDLASAAEIAGLFTDGQPAALSVRDGQNAVVATYPIRNDRRVNVPTMILIDRHTCGASETLAAVLRKARGVMLVGAPTRGDDRLREALPLSDGRQLYIATRRIDPGAEHRYFGIGVQPGVTVVESAGSREAKNGNPDEESGLLAGLSDREKQDRALATRVSGDAALRRAVDIVLGLKALNIRVP